MEEENKVRDVLKGIYDPEIPINIVDLGLVYSIEIGKEDKSILTITIGLTTINCPNVTDFIESIKSICFKEFPNFTKVNVNVSFDPPWNPDMISPSGLLDLNILK